MKSFFFLTRAKSKNQLFLMMRFHSKIFRIRELFFCLEIESISSSRLKKSPGNSFGLRFGSFRFVRSAKKSRSKIFPLTSISEPNLQSVIFPFQAGILQAQWTSVKIIETWATKKWNYASALKVRIKHWQLTSWPKFWFTQSYSKAFLFKVKELNFVNRKCSLIIEEWQEWCRI